MKNLKKAELYNISGGISYYKSNNTLQSKSSDRKKNPFAPSINVKKEDGSVKLLTNFVIGGDVVSASLIGIYNLLNKCKKNEVVEKMTKVETGAVNITEQPLYKTPKFRQGVTVFGAVCLGVSVISLIILCANTNND